MGRRMDRVNMVLRQEISRLLAVEMKDPRLALVVSVTRVDTSADLQHAKVYVSVLGDEDTKRHSLEALASAAGFLHREMRHSLSLRHVPGLRFLLDESIEKGAEMLEVIKAVSPETPQREQP